MVSFSHDPGDFLISRHYILVWSVGEALLLSHVGQNSLPHHLNDLTFEEGIPGILVVVLGDLSLEDVDACISEELVNLSLLVVILLDDLVLFAGRRPKGGILHKNRGGHVFFR